MEPGIRFLEMKVGSVDDALRIIVIVRSNANACKAQCITDAQSDTNTP